ncbi:MAG: hypothetical protein HKO68_04775 [Desulfobacterales bacterium]|nr:hypothetical protein [Desulfobacterales bacterium]
MLCFRYFKIGLTVILFILIAITGCTSFGDIQKKEIKSIKPVDLPSGNGWWYARFRMHWPLDTKPSWYIDLYLAHQVIMPLLEEKKDDILLWRFHRRAGRDRTGHQFSFIFYSTPRTAQHIYSQLQSDPLLIKMKFAGVIARDIYDNPAKITRHNIENTSDKNWPASIQKTWPYYIMGVSQMWLNLIAEVADDTQAGTTPSSLLEIEKFYQQINDALTALWQEKGCHAFIHHLNAIFGYEPLIYWEKRYLTF